MVRTNHGARINVEFSEKSCYAKLFDDKTFEIKIAKTPHSKNVGKNCENLTNIFGLSMFVILLFKQFIKSSKQPDLDKGFVVKDSSIAEAAPKDSLWGIGMNASDQRLKVPSRMVIMLLVMLMKTRQVL